MALRPAARCSIKIGQLLCGLMLAVVFLSSSPGPAGAASNGLWSITPTVAPGQPPRPYVITAVAPGKVYRGSVTIANLTPAPLTFNVYPADGLNTSGGGLSLRRRTDPQTGIGAWTHVAQSQVSVPGRTDALVPFAINPPANAAPGDHVGGIVAEETQGVQSHSGSLPVTVLQAVAVRIYARVSGPLHPGLAIHNLSLKATGGTGQAFTGSTSAKVSFTIVNNGNTVVDPNTTVSSSATIGGGATLQHVYIGQLLPGSSVSSSVTLPSMTVFGNLQTTVTATSNSVHASSSAATTVIPWGLLALLALALLALAYLLIYLLRRHGRRRATPT